MVSIRYERRHVQTKMPPVIERGLNPSLKKILYKYAPKLKEIGPNSLSRKFLTRNQTGLSPPQPLKQDSIQFSLLRHPCSEFKPKLKAEDVEQFINEAMPVSENIKNGMITPPRTPPVEQQYPIPDQAHNFTGKYNNLSNFSAYLYSYDIVRQTYLNNEKNLTQTPPYQLSPSNDYKKKKKKTIEKISLRRKEQERQALLSSLTQPILRLCKPPSNLMETINNAMNGKISFTLTPQDLSTLAPRSWLNDEIINHTLTLVLKRSQSAKNAEYPKIHVFNTFFYTFLKTGGYNRVKKWTRKIDLFSLDLVLIPVHLGNHWCMAGIDFRSKRIIYFDSMLGSGDSASDLLLNYVAKEYLEKKGAELNCTEWKKYIPTHIPVQENCYDCGVFAIMFGRCLASPHFPIHDIPKQFPFSQADMSNLRQLIAYEIITDQLLF